MSKLSRRDFLKLTAASATGLGLAGSRFLVDTIPAQKSDKPNILILLFDAMSVMGP